MKLENNYFDLKMQKALRLQPNGAMMTIVYLKMQLKSLSNEGILKYEGYYPNFDEELAADINEDIQDVRMTIAYLKKFDALIEIDDKEFLLNEMQGRIGSITDSALRVQKHREKYKALQCNNDVTKCNSIIDIEQAKDININNTNSAGAHACDIYNNSYYINLRGEHKQLADEIITTFINFANDFIKSGDDKVYYSHNYYSLQEIYDIIDKFDVNSLCKVMQRMLTKQDIHDRKHYIIATCLAVCNG